ncbi:MAG: aminopeptidase [Bacteroidetes bacterium]|nr:aminopeptidase [Bacteroidota bacterium]
MSGKFILSLFVINLIVSCSSNSTPSEKKDSSDSLLNARHSYSNYDEARLDSLHLYLKIDFKSQMLRGIAHWRIADCRSESIVLDTRSMEINQVWVDGVKVNFEQSGDHPIFGKGLRIPVRKESKSLEIAYTTHPDAEALQWMKPEQTAGGKPFLYTQSQAILARTWVPCMDVPAVRFTYSASVECDSQYRVLMSAENPKQRDKEGLFQFSMNQPIPSYLLALAAGDIQYHAYEERCGVFAEPVVLNKAIKELKDLPAMINAAEELYGPYHWGKYDVLFLPSSFPFGGMENPRLTFATPTILAGDGSLVALVAHELAHSWSGNLVTNRTWNDFWLNEGFTVYFEQRIMEAVYGKEYSDMLEVLGYEDLKSTLEEMKPDDPDSKLYLDLYGRDPDDGVSDIAYEKGRFFLVHLENLVGRENFDAFLREYFAAYAFQTMTTVEFIDYLRSDLLNKNPAWLEGAHIDEWVYQPGLPNDFVPPVSEAFQDVDSIVPAILSDDPNAIALTKTWTTHHWLHFIRGLNTPMDTNVLRQLDRRFGFSQANAEIADRWFVLAVQSNWVAMEPFIRNFLNNVGRRKFLTPLYRAMHDANPYWQTQARLIYEVSRPGYHAVSIGTLNELFEIE